MKRHNNLFDLIIAEDNIELAYRKARKGKTKKPSVKKFIQNEKQNLYHIQGLLLSGKFTTSSYSVKRIYEPKEREIFILPFSPDRIVQHAIMNVLEPIWDDLLISDSYACRIGKGIHKGSIRTMEFIRRNKYCLKMDISKFYPSMCHSILFNIIKKKIKCARTLKLLEDIIYSISGGKNIPIGNYTSQWFGNLYLNELDQFLKHILKIKDYIRYCDDFLCFSNSKVLLKDISIKLQDFVWSKLRLILSKCDLFPISRGVDFLGYRHFRNYILLRKSTAKRVIRRLKLLPLLLKSGSISKESYISSLASTKGWLQWANSYNFRIKLQLQNLQSEVL